MKLASERVLEQWQKLLDLGKCPPAGRPRLRARWIKAVEALMAVDCSQMGEMLREAYPADGIAAAAARPNPLFEMLRLGSVTT